MPRTTFAPIARRLSISCAAAVPRPSLARAEAPAGIVAVTAFDPERGEHRLWCEGPPALLFTDVKSHVSETPGAYRVYPISKPLPRFNTPKAVNHFTSACSTIGHGAAALTASENSRINGCVPSSTR